MALKEFLRVLNLQSERKSICILVRILTVQRVTSLTKTRKGLRSILKPFIISKQMKKDWQVPVLSAAKNS